MRIVLKRAMHFITCKGKFLGSENQITVKETLLITSKDSLDFSQLSMFSNDEIRSSILIGEL